MYVGSAVSRTRWSSWKVDTRTSVQPVRVFSFVPSTLATDTLRPRLCAAATQACAGLSTAAGGALPSPAIDEDTYATFPPATPTVTIPSCVSARLPKR